MSAAVGGRSEGIGAAPDRSTSQTASTVSKTIQGKKFEELSEKEKQIVISGGKFDKVPFGATPEALFTRSEFFKGNANKFLTAPSGANVDRKTAAARVQTLDAVIAQAQAAAAQNGQDRQRLEEQGFEIYSGSPLDIAFSNKAHEYNNIIAQAQSEKIGIELQTETSARKSLFDGFKVITDKRGGTGRNRGVFDPSGRGGLSKEQAAQIQKQELTVADLPTAISNIDKIKAAFNKINATRIRKANQDGHSGARIQRGLRNSDIAGNKNFTQRIDDRPDAEFFTDQLLSNDINKTTVIDSPEFAEINKAEIERQRAIGAPIAAQFNRKDGGEAFQEILGRSVPFHRRFSSNMKSGTNSRGVSDLERQQFINTKAAELQATKRAESDLSTIQESPIVKVADNTSIPFNRQASLYEALQTLTRIQGLPQFSGASGSHDTIGKARLGALNKVQNQRIAEQAKEGSRLQTKLNFEKEVQDIQSQNLNQKEKKAAIIAAAKRRDEGLQGKIASNTQFEQSRAGFAASRVNIQSGNTVRSVQDYIDLGRKKAKERNLINFV